MASDGLGRSPGPSQSDGPFKRTDLIGAVDQIHTYQPIPIIYPQAETTVPFKGIAPGLHMNIRAIRLHVADLGISPIKKRADVLGDVAWKA